MNIKNITTILLLFLLAANFTGCKDKLDFLPDQTVSDYVRIYMPQAVNPQAVRTLKITDDIQTAIYGANLGGLGYAATDIQVTFRVNKTAVDSFNTVNRTTYALLPESAYTLSALNAVIPQGGLSTAPLKINFKTKGAGAMDAFRTYILPISISGSGMKVNESLRTTCYLVTAQPDFADYPDFDRAGWKILAFSSQEANGEGPNNGRAVFVLDGINTTYWHSQWQAPAALPPHSLTIDMGLVQTLHGLSFVGRQVSGNGKPNEVNVQTSMDNLTWNDAGTFNLLNNVNLQKQFLPLGFNKQARYFKVIVNSAYGATNTQIAELNAF
jgi:hypothetical protein